MSLPEKLQKLAARRRRARVRLGKVFLRKKIFVLPPIADIGFTEGKDHVKIHGRTYLTFNGMRKLYRALYPKDKRI